MKINAPDKNSLVILLDKADMERLNLNFSNLLYSNEHTKEIIKALFCDACIKLGRKPQMKGSTLIEAVPFEDGSCLICFTISEKRQKIKVTAKLKCAQNTYQFESKEDFEKLLAGAKSKGIAPEGDLYRLNDTYRFITGSKELKSLFSEFAELINHPLAENYTKEYFTLCEAMQ